MAHPALGSSNESRTEPRSSKPLGISFLEKLKNAKLSYRAHQTIVLILTFIAYSCYHVTRKTTSIIKPVFDPKTPEMSFSPWARVYFRANAKDSGWAPFNGPDGTTMLGNIDVAFLSVYAFGMYLAGHLGDRLDLRVVLTIGMIGTGVFTSMFGIGYWLDIHSFYYYLVVQMLAGLFQSSGWPSVVAVMGNWFGRRKRGLIMGIWNAHTSVGNISGSLIAAAMLKYGWGWSFAAPGLLISLVGFVVFLLLPVSPEAVGIGKEEVRNGMEKSVCKEPLLEVRDEVRDRAVGFMEAWRIPGVAPFALCLFFSKLVAYTFLYWLPFYISHTASCQRLRVNVESLNCLPNTKSYIIF